MTAVVGRLAPAVAPSPFHRLLRQLGNVVVLTGRNLVHIAREPLQLSDVTIQPVLFTALFVYVFGAGVVLPHGGSYASFAIAGMLALNLMTSAMGTAVGLSTDLNGGIIDRFRSLPMWRPAVLVGRSVTDLLTAVICAFFVCVTGLLVGWRPEGSVASTIGGFALFLFFSYSLSWGCACLGIVSKAVLRVVANWNPISAVTAACRQLFANPNPSATVSSWPMQHAIVTSLLWSAGMLAVFAPLAAHLFVRRTRG